MGKVGPGPGTEEELTRSLSGLLRPGPRSWSQGSSGVAWSLYLKMVAGEGPGG